MIPQNFYVDVNVNYNSSTSTLGNVSKCVLISKTALETKTFTTLQQVLSDYTSTPTAPEVLASTIYFNNGGKNLLIYKQGGSDSDADTIADILDLYNDFVFVTFTATKNQAEILEISNALKASTQSLPKLLAQTIADETIATGLKALNVTNVVLLYSTEDILLPYTAICIPSYFSSVNLNIPNSLKSIVFTQIQGVEINDIDNEELEDLYDKNVNIIINLADRYIVLDGGKTVAGEPIHSAFGFSVFKNDCENTLIDLLINKLQYEDQSTTIIENALSSICEKYVTNGLIGINKIYTQDTQTIVYNGTQYTTISKNEVLQNGYKIFSVPISNATSNDKLANRIPPIYIYSIINDVIRLITLNVEVSK